MVMEYLTQKSSKSLYCLKCGFIPIRSFLTHYENKRDVYPSHGSYLFNCYILAFASLEKLTFPLFDHHLKNKD